jgi:hypothetical protein
LEITQKVNSGSLSCHQYQPREIRHVGFSAKDPFGARPPRFCMILLHSNGLQDDLLPPASTTRERSCGRSRTPTAAQPPSMARLQRLEIGRGRLINLCRAGCPLPPPSCKSPLRACRRGRALDHRGGCHRLENRRLPCRLAARPGPRCDGRALSRWCAEWPFASAAPHWLRGSVCAY